MYNDNYKIGYSEKDMNGFVKPHVLLDKLSDIATKNADFCGIGYNDISKKNLGWFLIKYAIEFIEYPQNVDELNLGTDPRGSHKLFTYRNFEIKDINGKLLGRLSSIWCLIDLETKKLLNSKTVFPDIVPELVKNDSDLEYEKIPPITDISAEKTIETSYYDIDLNEHVNNANYILWAMEVLPVEFLQTKQIKRMDITFKKELKLGGIALSQVEIKNNTTIHSIKNKETNEDLCLFKIEWI